MAFGRSSLRLLVATALFFAGWAAPARAALVGILGDTHGNAEPFRKALAILRDRGVSYIVGTGDFVGWGGPPQLDAILAMIESITGVKPENTYLVPGNWEHETDFPAADMNAVLRKYGHLVAERYDEAGSFTIEGQHIFLSHYPVRPVPEVFLPPPAKRIDDQKQIFFMDVMARNAPVAAGTDLAIFAHTHVGGAYYDVESGVYFLNSGVLDLERKTVEEPLGVGVYDTRLRRIEFVNAQTGATLHRLDIAPARIDKTLPCAINARSPITLNARP